MTLRELVDQIVVDGFFTAAERDELERAVTADPELSDEERTQIARIVGLIQSGELTCVAEAPGHLVQGDSLEKTS